MAVDSAAPVSEQLKLLAGARWHAFRNSMRRKQKRAELVFKILFWLSAVSTMVFGGLAFFATSYFLFPKKPAMLIALFWVLFAVWQLMPLILEGQSPALDFREIARYPITFRLFFMLSLAYGLLDPSALLAIVWGACTWLGVVLVSPQYFWRITLAFALFFPMNLVMNRVVFNWITRITQTRTGRERTMAFTLLIIVALQFVFWMTPAQVERSPRLTIYLPKFAAAASSAFPPGWAANIVLAPTTAALEAVAVMLLTAALFAVIFYKQSRRTFAGELASEGARRAGAVQVQPGWSFPFLSRMKGGGPFSAALEKELRYLRKDPRLFTNLLMVWGFAFVSTASSGMWRDAFHFDPTKSGSQLYPAMVGYSLLVINMLCFNIFGNDPPGFQRWLLSPLSMRSVIAAKNLAYGCVVALDTIVITTIFRLRAPIPLAMLAKVVLGVIYVSLVMIAAGNVLSVWFPKKIIPGKLSGKNVSEAGVIISMVVMVALGASWFAAVTFAAVTHRPWIPYAAYAVFVLIAAALYMLSLRLAPAYMVKRQDNLLADLG